MCQRPAPELPPAFDLTATAALLRSLSPLVWASQLCAYLAFHLPYGWVSLLLWPVALCYAVRIQLDAGLFELLAQSPAQLDQWLTEAGLRAKPAVERPLSDRCQGACRLARHFVIVCVLQLVTLAAAYLYREVAR